MFGNGSTCHAKQKQSESRRHRVWQLLRSGEALQLTLQRFRKAQLADISHTSQHSAGTERFSATLHTCTGMFSCILKQKLRPSVLSSSQHAKLEAETTHVHYYVKGKTESTHGMRAAILSESACGDAHKAAAAQCQVTPLAKARACVVICRPSAADLTCPWAIKTSPARATMRSGREPNV